MKPNQITIVDDDREALLLLRCMLGRLYPACDISMFPKASDALVQVLARGTDIVITNHATGPMSGVDLIRKLRARHSLLPIIMLSGNPAVESAAVAAGATVFIDKNSDPEEIAAHLRALVELLDGRAPRRAPKPSSRLVARPQLNPKHRLGPTRTLRV